ncbi:MAG: phosphatase domain-containing protein [Bacteriovoracaceae bacterium]
MKKIIPIITSLHLFLFSQSVFSKTILVSDIDDTIKNSHVLDLDELLRNSIKTAHMSFMGMADVYQKMVDDKTIDSIVYLSNAPKSLMHKYHQLFLDQNQFPEGTLILKRHIFTKNHKVRALRQLIEEQSPDELLLIGDNGEHDTEIYEQIESEYPKLKMTTFIHQVYSKFGVDNNFGKPLEQGQLGFATSVDLSAQLKKQNFLSDESYASIISTFIPVALEDRLFPSWQDCRDLELIDFPSTRAEDEELISKFESKLLDRCINMSLVSL